MVIRYAIVRREDPSHIHEVIPYGNIVNVTSPEFFSGGNPFSYNDFTVREMTTDEIEMLVSIKRNEDTDNRRKMEYDEWVVINDRCDSENIKSFELRGDKFFTINRGEFMKLKTDTISEGKYSVTYRNEIFSVYHYC